MNVKNIILALCMFGAAFGSSVAVAGVPTNMLDGLDQVAAVSAGGLLGAGALGTFGAVRAGSFVGACVAGPIGAVAGAVVGGAVGWSGLVVFKAFHNELKRR